MPFQGATFYGEFSEGAALSYDGETFQAGPLRPHPFKKRRQLPLIQPPIRPHPAA